MLLILEEIPLTFFLVLLFRSIYTMQSLSSPNTVWRKMSTFFSRRRFLIKLQKKAPFICQQYHPAGIFQSVREPRY